MKNNTIVTITLLVSLGTFSCGTGDPEADSETGGYNSDTIPATPRSDTALNRSYVSVLDINFRTEPDADAPKVKGREALYWGTEFDVIAEEGDWVNVRLDDGTTGWLRRLYEDNVYVRDINEKEIANYEKYPAIDSAEFLAMAENEANKWTSDYRLIFLSGEDGALDGKCYKWTAFFTSGSKPGKKLMCSYNDRKSGDRLFSDEWNADWVWYDGTPEDDIGVAPWPIWLNRGFRDIKARADGDIISTSKLCTAPNLNGMINAVKETPDTNVVSMINNNSPDCSFAYIIDGQQWVILTDFWIGNHLRSFFTVHDGRYSETYQYTWDADIRGYNKRKVSD